MSRRGHIDYVLLGAVLALSAIGVQMVYSSSIVIAHNEFGDERYFLVRQASWVAIGLAAMAVAASVDYHRWQKVSAPFLLACMVALVLVLIPGLGVIRYGSARWLDLGFLPDVQPSEVAKVAIVIYLADWLPRKGRDIGKLGQGSIPFAIIVGLVGGLVLLEPDLGTAVIICATAFSVFFIAGANLWHIALGAIPGSLLLWWAVHAAAYRADRWAAFVDPWSDPQGKGWHTIQTLIALGSGGLTGVGPGMSRQKGYYIPNAHTDAILAIIGEELGLIGTMGVLLLFVVVGWRGIRIAMRAPDGLGRLLAAGMTSMILWQAVVNVGAVTNSLPYTGVTLPFVSFGGSSICMKLVAVGVLLSVSRFSRSVPVARQGERQPGRHPPPRGGLPATPSRRRRSGPLGGPITGGARA